MATTSRAQLEGSALAVLDPNGGLAPFTSWPDEEGGLRIYPGVQLQDSYVLLEDELALRLTVPNEGETDLTDLSGMVVVPPHLSVTSLGGHVDQATVVVDAADGGPTLVLISGLTLAAGETWQLVIFAEVGGVGPNAQDTTFADHTQLDEQAYLSFDNRVGQVTVICPDHGVTLGETSITSMLYGESVSIGLDAETTVVEAVLLEPFPIEGGEDGSTGGDGGSDDGAGGDGSDSAGLVPVHDDRPSTFAGSAMAELGSSVSAAGSRRALSSEGRRALTAGGRGSVPVGSIGVPVGGGLRSHSSPRARACKDGPGFHLPINIGLEEVLPIEIINGEEVIVLIGRDFGDAPVIPTLAGYFSTFPIIHHDRTFNAPGQIHLGQEFSNEDQMWGGIDFDGCDNHPLSPTVLSNQDGWDDGVELVNVNGEPFLEITWNGLGYVNVLIDRNDNKSWECQERVLANAFSQQTTDSVTRVPLGSIAHLQGSFWVRVTITLAPLFTCWNGGGAFIMGETEDYLLKIHTDPNAMDDAALTTSILELYGIMCDGEALSTAFYPGIP
ncbi:MAG: hypothetical protein AAF533_09265 [Acidobacteriota bacterium]